MGIRRELIRQYGPRWLAIVLIDEIDGIKKALPQNTRFFANLRDLVSSSEWSAHFRLIVTGTNELGGLRSAGSPLKNVLARRELGIIDHQAVHELAAVGFKNRLSGDTLESLLALSGGHPYLVHGLLAELWFLLAEKTGLRSNNRITPLHVEQAAGAFMAGYSDLFEDWTNSIGTLGCQVYGKLLANGDDLSPKEIAKSFTKTPREIESSIARLATHGVVDAREGINPKLSGTLFADWFNGSIVKPAIEEALLNVERILQDIDISANQTKGVAKEIASIRNALGRDIFDDQARISVGKRFRAVVERTKSFADGISAVEKIVETLTKVAPYVPGLVVG